MYKRQLLKDVTRIENAEIKGHIDAIIQLVKENITIDWLNNEMVTARVKKEMRDYLLGIGFNLAEANKTRDDLFHQVKVIFADYVPAPQ